MKTKSLQSQLFKLLILTTLFLAVFLAGPLPAKNFYFPQVKIEIFIHEDGSFQVEEARTYDFEGTFSWASRWIPLRVSRQGYSYTLQIKNFRGTDEQGQPLPVEKKITGDRFEAKWYYQAADERRTFHFSYLVEGGIFSYPDVSELYWQVIGSGWDKPTASLEVKVHLPRPVKRREDLLVYGHGPLSGQAEIVDLQTARFTASHIPAYQFVEIRVIWPAGLVQGIPSNRQTLASIKAEEERFVRETIARLKEKQQKLQQVRARRKRLFFIWGALLILGTIIWVIIYLKIWKKEGREYQFDDIPEYWREPPSDLPPALVEVLMREGGLVTTNSFTATLFDLARRGWVTIEDTQVTSEGLFGPKRKTKTSLILQRNYYQAADLESFEKDVLRLVFNEAGPGGHPGSTVTLAQLKKYLKKHPQKFQQWFQKWQKKIDLRARQLGFIEPRSRKIKNRFLAISIVAAILTLNPVVFVLALILSPRIKRRAYQWARENEYWRALRYFLEDFSNFPETPPEAYKLWDRYLVMAILFGEAKKILKKLPLIIQDDRAVAPVWYAGFNRQAWASSGRIEAMIKNIGSMSASLHLSLIHI